MNTLTCKCNKEFAGSDCSKEICPKNCSVYKYILYKTYFIFRKMEFVKNKVANVLRIILERIAY